MKVLVINPPDENTIVEFPKEDGSSFLEADDYGYFPPLGALYVLSYLEKHTEGFELYFLDCVAEQITHTELSIKIAQIRPDLVGMTSFTIGLVDIVLAAENIKQINPNIHICLGGHHSISYPYEAAELKNIDSIIVGEGEVAFKELAEALRDKKSITHIEGVYTANSIKSAENPKKDRRFLNSVIVKPAYISDINQLPFPNRNFIKHINYQSIVGITNKLATLISSRGCPYLCTFCNVPYKEYRSRTAENILDEVQECLNIGYKEFHFYDDLFNITPERIFNICDEIEKRAINFIWDFRGRVNGVSYESLKRAKECGCRMISFGVETGSNEGMKTLRKGCTMTMVENAFKWCKELGIVTIADYMIGLPHEKCKQDIIDNINYVIDLNPDYVQFNILTLYPHTEAYNNAVKKGLIEGGRWHEFSKNPKKDFKVDHWEEFLSIDELVKLHHYAYKKFYFRPSYVLKSVLEVKSPYQFFTKFRGLLKIV